MPQAMLLMMPFVVGVLATVMGLTLVRGRPGTVRLALAGLGFCVGAVVLGAMLTPCVHQQLRHGSLDTCSPAVMVMANPWFTAALVTR